MVVDCGGWGTNWGGVLGSIIVDFSFLASLFKNSLGGGLWGSSPLTGTLAEIGFDNVDCSGCGIVDCEGGGWVCLLVDSDSVGFGEYFDFDK